MIVVEIISTEFLQRSQIELFIHKMSKIQLEIIVKCLDKVKVVLLLKGMVIKSENKRTIAQKKKKQSVNSKTTYNFFSKRLKSIRNILTGFV